MAGVVLIVERQWDATPARWRTKRKMVQWVRP